MVKVRTILMQVDQDVKMSFCCGDECRSRTIDTRFVDIRSFLDQVLQYGHVSIVGCNQHRSCGQKVWFIDVCAPLHEHFDNAKVPMLTCNGKWGVMLQLGKFCTMLQEVIDYLKG